MISKDLVWHYAIFQYMKQKWREAFSLAILLILVGLIAFLVLNLNAKNENVVLEIPNSWQQISIEDRLVRGLCLGSGSECGYILLQYSTGSTKELALEEGSSALKSTGWNFETEQVVRDELQVVARKKDKLLYLTSYEGGVRIRYEENH